MLSIAPILKPSLRYYQELTTEQYKQEGGERPGTWMGRGAQMLDLWVKTAQGFHTQAMDAATFDALADGLHPHTGTPLRAYAGKPRKPESAMSAFDASRKGTKQYKQGWDLTLTAPKDVSILWALGNDKVRRDVELAHRYAVASAVEFMEESAFVSRRGTVGGKAEKVGAVIAAFEHCTSRAQDPLLHTHLLVFNIGVRDDGSTGALRSRDLFVYRRAIDAIYNAALATAIRTQLRVPLEVTLYQPGFVVQNVSERLREGFSRRRQMIEAQLSQWERAGGISAKLAALQTRHRKSHVSQQTLRPQWKLVADALHIDIEALQRPTLPENMPDTAHVAGQVRLQTAATVKLLADAMGLAREPEVIAAVVQRSMLTGIPSAQLRGFIKESLATHPDIAMVHRPGAAFAEFTSRQLIETEKQLLSHAAALADQRARPLVLKAHDIFFPATWKLNEEQAKALAYLTSRESDLRCLDGIAGTGKTTLLKAANKVFTQTGNQVIGLAVAGKATMNLYTGTGIPTVTVASMLQTLQRHESFWSTLKPHPFAKRPVIVVDEASMLGTLDAEVLFRHAKNWHCRLVLVGDRAQLPSVPAGGVFDRLCRTQPCFKMTQVVRQQVRWMRDVVAMAAEGNAVGALSEYAARGLLHVEADKASAIDKMVRRFAEMNGPQRRNTAMLASTNEDVDAINALMQETLKLGFRLGVQYATDRRGRIFYVKDRVIFTENEYRTLNIRNGEQGTIHIIEHGPGELVGGRATLIVRMDAKDPQGNERYVRVPLARFDAIDLGYAMTTHKAQGTTVNSALVLLDARHTSSEHVYVQLSRHTQECELFTDSVTAGEDCHELALAAQKSVRKQLVHDTAPLTQGQREQPALIHPRPRIEADSFQQSQSRAYGQGM